MPAWFHSPALDPLIQHKATDAFCSAWPIVSRLT